MGAVSFQEDVDTSSCQMNESKSCARRWTKLLANMIKALTNRCIARTKVTSKPRETITDNGTKIISLFYLFIKDLTVMIFLFFTFLLVQIGGSFKVYIFPIIVRHTLRAIKERE